MIPREYLGAFKAGHRAKSREFIDEELSYKLLDKVMSEGCEESRRALEYLTKFNNEFHKNVLKKGDPNALHNTDELRKACYNRNYALVKDDYPMTGRGKVSLDDHPKMESFFNSSLSLSHEDHLIELIDLLDDPDRLIDLILRD